VLVPWKVLPPEDNHAKKEKPLWREETRGADRRRAGPGENEEETTGFASQEKKEEMVGGPGNFSDARKELGQSGRREKNSVP